MGPSIGEVGVHVRKRRRGGCTCGLVSAGWVDLRCITGLHILEMEGGDETHLCGDAFRFSQNFIDSLCLRELAVAHP